MRAPLSPGALPTRSPHLTVASVALFGVVGRHPGRTRAGVAAVVVNHDAGEALLECVRVVARRRGAPPSPWSTTPRPTGRPTPCCEADRRRASRAHRGQPRLRRRRQPGIAGSATELVLVANPDLAVHRRRRGARWSTCSTPTRPSPSWAPRSSRPTAPRYPSARRFPSFVDAAGHAAAGRHRPAQPLHPAVPHGRPRRPTTSRPVDWVSGACFLARRRASRSSGGSTRPYFMYAEDTDLCWRARRAGWGVAYVPARRGHPPAGGVHGPAPVPDAGGPPPIGLPLRRRGPSGAGAAWRYPMAVVLARPARGRCAPGRRLVALRRGGGPGRVGLLPDHGQGDRKMGAARRCHGWRPDLSRARCP